MIHIKRHFYAREMLNAPSSKLTYDRSFNLDKPSNFVRGGPKHTKYDDAQPDIEALMQVVGSKRARDITRKNRFMSKDAFDEWNAKATGGRNKYWGDYQDVDEDGVEEFVVRRGDEDGRLVAINGYTTKASDWAVRAPYYKKYPKIGTRPAGGLREYVRTDLYEEELDEYGYPTDAYLQRIKDARQKYPKYAIHVSTSTSPYNLFVKNIVSPALNLELNSELNLNETERKTFMQEMEKVYHKGWLLKLAAELWTSWVKTPILKKMRDSGVLDDWKAKYNQTHFGADSADSKPEKFEKWLFNKAEMKRAVREYTKDMLKTDGETFNEAIDAVVNVIDGMVQQAIGNDKASPPTSPAKKRYIERYGA